MFLLLRAKNRKLEERGGLFFSMRASEDSAIPGSELQ